MNVGVYLNRSMLKNSALSTCTPGAASHTPSFTSTSSCSWSCLCWNSVKLFISQSILSLKKKHDGFGWLKEEGRDTVITGTIYSFKDLPFTFPVNRNNRKMLTMISISLALWSLSSFSLQIHFCQFLHQNPKSSDTLQTFLKRDSMPADPGKQNNIGKSHSEQFNCANITSPLWRRPGNRCCFLEVRFFLLFFFCRWNQFLKQDFKTATKRIGLQETVISKH